MKLKKIFIAGHNGMVGNAIYNLLLEDYSAQYEVITRSRDELDLTDQNKVKLFFSKSSIDVVIIAAAKVGGIFANNTYPAEFIYENMMIQSNLIHQSYISGIKKLLFLGSSCIYPKDSIQPIKENFLLSGKLEPTNEPYAIAKIAGIKMCESYNRQYGLDYRCIMPTNLYGPGDNFHLDNSHVVPALLRRFHEAKIKNHSIVKVWGSGKPMRELMHVNDMASASLFLLNLNKETYMTHVKKMVSHVNAGTGDEVSIKDLAYLIKDVVSYEGKIIFDSSKPDGVQRKLMDSDAIKQMGWNPSIELHDGLNKTYEYFLSHEIRTK